MKANKKDLQYIFSMIIVFMNRSANYLQNLADNAKVENIVCNNKSKRAHFGMVFYLKLAP